MAVRKPRRNTSTGVRKPVVPKGAETVFEPPAMRRAKPFSQTATPRTRGGGDEEGFRATALPTPAVRRRGSKMGQYLPEDENQEFAFPQIDPTATSNPEKPRTLQAGYYRERGEATGTLRVRFRDGTPWEYLDVPPNVWRNFRRVKSPGRFINRVLNNYDYQRGNF